MPEKRAVLASIIRAKNIAGLTTFLRNVKTTGSERLMTVRLAALGNFTAGLELLLTHNCPMFSSFGFSNLWSEVVYRNSKSPSILRLLLNYPAGYSDKCIKSDALLRALQYFARNNYHHCAKAALPFYSGPFDEIIDIWIDQWTYCREPHFEIMQVVLKASDATLSPSCIVALNAFVASTGKQYKIGHLLLRMARIEDPSKLTLPTIGWIKRVYLKEMTDLFERGTPHMAFNCDMVGIMFEYLF